MGYSIKRIVEYDMCDTLGRLSLKELVRLASNVVASYFESIKKDNNRLKKEYNAMWVFTKNRLYIEALPKWNDVLCIEAKLCKISKASTIVEIFIRPETSKEGIRSYIECCALDIKTRRLKRLSELDFPMLAEKEEIITYTKWNALDYQDGNTIEVCASHIDFSRHTNNAEYIRMIIDEYTIEELENRELKEAEIHYLAESMERDLLKVKKCLFNKEHYFNIERGNRTIFEMKIKWK